MNGEADLAAIVSVEIGVRREKCLCFLKRAFGKAVDIMMAVALGMGHADEGAEREVLLHGEPRLAGEVFARDEESLSLAAPLCGARGVDDRLVEALAGFRRDAAIAERTRGRKGIVGIIGLIDDEIARRKPLRG